tara:strand:+ start:40 stop:918 length:879 start_codon:yes stop_codon:yes gene_type:complete
MSIDLHIHSVNSDGTFTVAEIINLSKELQLEAISITDHEYLTEVPANNDIKIIKGIEIGADWKELKSKNLFAGIHLLVYFLERNTALNIRLEEIRNKKKERNYLILESLKKLGIDIEKSELDLMRTKVPGRPHIAQIMVEKQYVNNVSEAFTKFLRNGIIPNIDTHQLDIQEIIQLSKESKSLIFLAHPHTLMSSESYKKNQNWVTSEFVHYLKQIKIMGLSGLEVYYPGYNSSVKAQLIEICESLDLLISGGSDFHGENKPSNLIGIGYQNNPIKVPLTLLSRMEEAHAKL